MTDGGSPPSGTASVTADVSAFDAGETSVPMTAGSWTAGGQSFSYRSAQLTANSPQAEASYGFSFALADVAGNSRTQTGFSVALDNTKPSGADIHAVDGNGDAGEPGPGDRVVFSFSEPIEPESILAGWTSGTATVTVRMRDGGVLLGLLGDDELEIRNAAKSATLPSGTIDLNAGGYATGLAGGYAVWSNSTMTMSGNSVTVTLGSSHSGLGTGRGAAAPRCSGASSRPSATAPTTTRTPAR